MTVKGHDTHITVKNSLKPNGPERQVKVSDHKSADHQTNSVFGAKN
jgi:hypothetical protein